MKQVASIAVIGSRDAILFIRRVDNGKWTLPGGHLNDNELPLDGALRELYEETGIRAPRDEMEAIGSGVVDGKYKVWSYQYKKAHVKPNLDNDPDGEADDWCWFDEDSDSDYASGIPKNVHVPNDKNVTLALLGRTTPSDALKLDTAADLVKMAIKDIPPGEPTEDEHGQEVHDFGHLLPPAWKSKLSLHVHAPAHGEYIKAHLLDADLKEVGHVKGELGKHRMLPESVMTPHSELEEDYHGEGLGKAMYEALYAHAFHNLGIRHIVGGSHSDDAGRVHEALARKHGLNYIKTTKNSRFGLNRGGYGYALDKNENLSSMGIQEANPRQAYADKISAMAKDLKAKIFTEPVGVGYGPGLEPTPEQKEINERILDDKFHDLFMYNREFDAAIQKHPKLARDLSVVGAFYEHAAPLSALFDKGAKEDIVAHIKGTQGDGHQRMSILNWLESTSRKEMVPAVIDAFSNGDRGRRHSAIANHLNGNDIHPDIMKEAIDSKMAGDGNYNYHIDAKDAAEYMDRKDVTPEQALKIAQAVGPRRLMNHPKIPVDDAFNYHIDHLDVRGLHPQLSGDQIRQIATKWDNHVGQMGSFDQTSMAYHPNTPKDVLRLFTHPQPPNYKPFNSDNPAFAEEFKNRSWLGGKEGAASVLGTFIDINKERALTDSERAAGSLAMVMGKNIAAPNRMIGDGGVRVNSPNAINRQSTHIYEHPLWQPANEIVNKYHKLYESAYGEDALFDANGSLKPNEVLNAITDPYKHQKFDEVHADAAKLKSYLDEIHQHDWKTFIKENKDQHEREQFDTRSNWERPDVTAQRGAASHPNTDRETALELARQRERYDAATGAVINPNLTPADLHDLMNKDAGESFIGGPARHALAVQDPDWHHASVQVRDPDPGETFPDVQPSMKPLAVPDVSTEKVRQLRDKVESLGGKAHHKKVVDNLSPALKPLLDAQGQLSADKLQEAINAVPTTTYHVGDSGTKWDGGQQHSDQASDVFHVNYTGEHVKKLKEAGVWNTFARIQNMITNPTNHPLGPTTIGWVRHTSAGDPNVPNQWNTDHETGKLLGEHSEAKAGIHIDEVQSDLGQRRLTQEFRDNGIHIPDDHLSKIREILWGKRKTAQDLVAEAFIHHHRQDPSKHGLAMHWPSHEMKVRHGSPEDTYKRLPKELGFAEKAGKYGDLATQTGEHDEGLPTHTSKITKAEDAFFDQPNHQHRELVNTAIEKLSNDLRKPQYQSSPNHLTGHCYVASEALYHMLGGNAAGWVPHHVKHEGEPHWYLKNKTNGAILDPTAGQFKTPVPYAEGRGKGFLTKEPSRRAVELISRIKAGMAAKNDPTLKKGFLGAVAGAAMAMSPGLQAGFDKVNPPQHVQEQAATHTVEAPAKPKWTPDGLHASLIPIAHLESSFGQNMNHAPNSKGDYHTAFGPVGFKVSTAHEEWNKTSQLKKLFPGLEDPKTFTDKFKNDWKFYNLVATSHFLRLTHRHGTPEKAAYAWRYGSTAAQGADESIIAKEPYVLRYRDLAATTGIKKAERKARDWKSDDGITIPHHTNVQARREWDKAYHASLVENFAYGNKARLKPISLPVSQPTGSNMPVNKARLSLYTKMARGGDRLPPVVVRRNGIGYNLLDGNHRQAAAQKAGLTHMDAYELVDPVTRKL